MEQKELRTKLENTIALFWDKDDNEAIDELIKIIEEEKNKAINFTDSYTTLKEKEEMTFKEFEKTFIKRTFENETFYETKQGLKSIEYISFMYDKYLENL